MPNVVAHIGAFEEAYASLEDGLRNAVEVGRDVAIEQQHAETAESGPVIVVYI